ncbi:MAG TPA: hypothetical protein VNF29_12175 [Candidatus Binataceae bacterium]|nr:hypothetical protein [Candidatus Binataceae bacterium]
MLSIAVVTDGQYDEVVCRELILKCPRDIKRVITRECRGSVLGKARGIVAELTRRKLATGILVIGDAEGGIAARKGAKDSKTPAEVYEGHSG